MSFILTYHWEFFIAIEIASILSLILFGVLRYFFQRTTLSMIFIGSFLLLLIFEAVLGFYVYTQTGEFSTFQMIVMIFIIYAFTFGIFDFIRLDRWMRQKIGSIRGVELLTEKDYQIIERNNNPSYIAKKYRRSSMIHLVIFLIGQTFLWHLGTENFTEIKSYITDFSWVETGTADDSPYANDIMLGIGLIWGIVFTIDFIYSWSYTFFPDTNK